MEDQPTDTSDLTDTETTKESEEGASAKPARASGAVPVGKRSGRHRTFRPRPVPKAESPETAKVEAPVDEAPVDESAETAEAREAAETVEDTPAEPAPKAKRRRWFGRRSGDTAAVTEVEAEPEIADQPTAVAEVSAPSDAEFAQDETEDETDEVADVTEVEMVSPRQAGRRLAIAVAVVAALFVAAGAFAGAMLQPYLSDRAVANTKMDIARTATAAITTLFTYTPDDMDKLPARSAKYLGGELKDAYAKQVDALAATNKQNQIHRSAQVVGAAVESLNGSNATAIVYANVTYNSAATKDVPKLFLVSYRLNMERKGSDWVITNMPWITSKDLTRLTP